MQASMFNVRVPLEDRNEVFLMNTFTDAQLIVSRDVVDLLDGVDALEPQTERERETLAQLVEKRFVVTNRAQERVGLQNFFIDVRDGTRTQKLTVSATL